jgi:hypothetical protein
VDFAGRDLPATLFLAAAKRLRGCPGMLFVEARHRFCICAGARGGVEGEAVVSCVVSLRWRGTEQELSCRESLENMHGSAARRALPGCTTTSW